MQGHALVHNVELREVLVHRDLLLDDVLFDVEIFDTQRRSHQL